MKLMVVDVTGSGRPPGMIYLEGRMTAAELKEKALRAIGVVDFLNMHRVEVRDGNGKVTTKITSDCIIFVNISLDASSKNPSDPLGILRDLGGFGNIFGDKR